MEESAGSTLRSVQREATAARLVAVARLLTAERGTSGFTIEELCSEVGVSRRTFFNYFPSKDDAVLGVDEHDALEHLSAEFLALGSRGWPAVVDDLVGLAAEYAQRAEFDPRKHADFFRAIEREPRLLTRFIGITREREQSLVELVATREDAPADDPRVRAAVQIVSTVMRAASERLLDPRHGADFGAALHDSLAAIRAVTAPPAVRSPDRMETE